MYILFNRVTQQRGYYMNRVGLLIIETISLFNTQAKGLCELIQVEQCRVGGPEPPIEMTSLKCVTVQSECKRAKRSNLLRVNSGSLSMFMFSVRPAKANATLVVVVSENVRSTSHVERLIDRFLVSQGLGLGHSDGNGTQVPSQ
jgi:hypothetical protein